MCRIWNFHGPRRLRLFEPRFGFFSLQIVAIQGAHYGLPGLTDTNSLDCCDFITVVTYSCSRHTGDSATDRRARWRDVGSGLCSRNPETQKVEVSRLSDSIVDNALSRRMPGQCCCA